MHVDAVQAFGRTDDVAAEADTRASRGTSCGARSRSAPSLTRPGVDISPVLLGGSQERGVRPGTTDPVAAAGLGAAARHALASPARWSALGPLRDALEAGLLRLAPGTRVNGAGAPRDAARREHRVPRLARAGARGRPRPRGPRRVRRKRVQRRHRRALRRPHRHGRPAKPPRRACASRSARTRRWATSRPRSRSRRACSGDSLRSRRGRTPRNEVVSGLQRSSGLQVAGTLGCAAVNRVGAGGAEKQAPARIA